MSEVVRCRVPEANRPQGRRVRGAESSDGTAVLTITESSCGRLVIFASSPLLWTGWRGARRVGRASRWRLTKPMVSD